VAELKKYLTEEEIAALPAAAPAAAVTEETHS
jgi:hypothetical protein